MHWYDCILLSNASVHSLNSGFVRAHCAAHRGGVITAHCAGAARMVDFPPPSLRKVDSGTKSKRGERRKKIAGGEGFKVEDYDEDPTDMLQPGHTKFENCHNPNIFHLNLSIKIVWVL